MAKAARDKVARFDAELYEAAAAEGRREARSATQQLAHWARLGRSLSSTTSAAQRRIEEVLAGRRPMVELGAEEGAALNARIDVAVEEFLEASHYGEALAGEGVTTVALDDEGRLVRHLPDGTTTILEG